MNEKYTNEDVVKFKKIAAVIRENGCKKKKINRLEYYLLGGKLFRDASMIIYDMRTQNKITFSEYYALNTYITKQLNIHVIYDKRRIMDIKFMYGENGNVVISDLEKEAIWASLISAGIDENCIDDVVFSGAVREYAIKKGYIKVQNNSVSKTKTLKK